MGGGPIGLGLVTGGRSALELGTGGVPGLVGLCVGEAKSAMAKALGILEGFSGRRVTAERIESGAGPLW